MVIEELVKTVLSEMQTITQTKTVIGDPISAGETTLLPVCKISLGFGAGGGMGDSKGKGGEATGGGVSIEPVAFLVVRGEKVDLITVKKEGGSLSQIIDMVPKVVDQVKDIKGKKNKESKSSEGNTSD